MIELQAEPPPAQLQNALARSLRDPSATLAYWLPAFQTYVAQVLTPQLQPGDVVIWDNLKPHQDAEVRHLIEQAGAELVPLPRVRPTRDVARSRPTGCLRGTVTLSTWKTWHAVRRPFPFVSQPRKRLTSSVGRTPS